MTEYVKSTTLWLKFKKIIKTWPGPRMQRIQIRMKLLLKHDIRYAQHFAKMNSDRCQASEVELFVKNR